MSRNEAIELLEAYTYFLQKEGFLDTDAACETPYAIDVFIKDCKLIEPLTANCLKK